MVNSECDGSAFSNSSPCIPAKIKQRRPASWLRRGADIAIFDDYGGFDKSNLDSFRPDLGRRSR